MSSNQNEASSSREFAKEPEEFYWANKFLMMMVAVRLVPVFLRLELEVNIFVFLPGLI